MKNVFINDPTCFCGLPSQQSKGEQKWL